MKGANLLIFDLDGTLVDSTRDIAEAINFTLKSLGLPERSVREIAECIGGGFEDTLMKAFGKENYEGCALPILREYYEKHAVVYSRLYPGVNEILDLYSSKCKVVLTNKDYTVSAKILKQLNIFEYFDMIVGGSDYERRKPDPLPVNMIVKKLNADKEKTIIIGDMDIDIVAGKKAGIVTCGVTYGIGNKENMLRANPDFVVDNIFDLSKIIS